MNVFFLVKSCYLLDFFINEGLMKDFNSIKYSHSDIENIKMIQSLSLSEKKNYLSKLKLQNIVRLVTKIII